MQEDAIKIIINDMRALAAMCKDPLTRLALEGIADRLQALCDAGLKIAPKAAVDVVPAKDATDGTTGTAGKKIYRYRDVLSMPRGIEMKEYGSSDGTLVFIGQYFGDGSCNPRPKRIYTIKVGCLPVCGEWHASVLDDGRLIVSLRGSTKWTVAHAALGALRGFLEYCCKNTNGNRKRRRRAAAAEKAAEGRQ